jgi:hypothetical protein
MRMMLKILKMHMSIIIPASAIVFFLSAQTVPCYAQTYKLGSQPRAYCFTQLVGSGRTDGCYSTVQLIDLQTSKYFICILHVGWQVVAPGTIVNPTQDVSCNLWGEAIPGGGQVSEFTFQELPPLSPIPSAGVLHFSSWVVDKSGAKVFGCIDADSDATTPKYHHVCLEAKPQ